jgi:hypothetical protein
MLTLVSASKEDNRDSFAIFEGAHCVGHIMRTHRAPQGKPWFWTIFALPSNMPDRGYAATREQAIADIEALWVSSKKMSARTSKHALNGTCRAL